MEPVAGNRTPISDCPPHSTSELLQQLFQSVHRQALLRFVFSVLPLNYSGMNLSGAIAFALLSEYSVSLLRTMFAIMDYTGLTNIPATLMLLV